MKYVIDEDVCSAHNLSIEEVFGILFCKTASNVKEVLSQMLESELLSNVLDNSGGMTIYPTQHWDDEVSAILLESDKTVPKHDRCVELAKKLQPLFPKGLKVGSSAWRGNIREISLRLQKFFKIYGSKWTDDEIIEATKRYISHFNGDYTTMRILKYFIMKSDRKLDEEGNSHIEDISDLATWLENDTEESYNNDWTIEIR